MRIENLAISLFLIAAIVTGMYYTINDMGAQLGVEPEDDYYSGIYDKTTQYSQTINQSYTDLTGEPTSVTNQFFTGVVLAWNSITLIASLPMTLMSVFIFETAAVIGWPAWVTGLAAGLITVLVLFGLISALLRWRA